MAKAITKKAIDRALRHYSDNDFEIDNDENVARPTVIVETNDDVSAAHLGHGVIAYSFLNEHFFLNFFLSEVKPYDVPYIQVKDKVTFTVFQDECCKRRAINVSRILNGKATTGRIVSLKDNYGFLERIDCMEDIYFPFTNFPDSKRLKVGQECRFTVTQLRNGKKEATSIRLLAPNSLCFSVELKETYSGIVMRPPKAHKTLDFTSGEIYWTPSPLGSDGGDCRHFPFGVYSVTGKYTLHPGDTVIFNTCRDRRNYEERASKVRLSLDHISLASCLPAIQSVTCPTYLSDDRDDGSGWYRLRFHCHGSGASRYYGYVLAQPWGFPTKNVDGAFVLDENATSSVRPGVLLIKQFSSNPERSRDSSKKSLFDTYEKPINQYKNVILAFIHGLNLWKINKINIQQFYRCLLVDKFHRIQTSDVETQNYSHLSLQAFYSSDEIVPETVDPNMLRFQLLDLVSFEPSRLPDNGKSINGDGHFRPVNIPDSWGCVNAMRITKCNLKCCNCDFLVGEVVELACDVLPLNISQIYELEKDDDSAGSGLGIIRYRWSYDKKEAISECYVAYSIHSVQISSAKIIPNSKVNFRLVEVNDVIRFAHNITVIEAHNIFINNNQDACKSVTFTNGKKAMVSINSTKKSDSDCKNLPTVFEVSSGSNSASSHHLDLTHSNQGSDRIRKHRGSSDNFIFPPPSQFTGVVNSTAARPALPKPLPGEDTLKGWVVFLDSNYGFIETSTHDFLVFFPLSKLHQQIFKTKTTTMEQGLGVYLGLPVQFLVEHSPADFQPMATHLKPCKEVKNLMNFNVKRQRQKEVVISRGKIICVSGKKANDGSRKIRGVIECDFTRKQFVYTPMCLRYLGTQLRHNDPVTFYVGEGMIEEDEGTYPIAVDIVNDITRVSGVIHDIEGHKGVLISRIASSISRRDRAFSESTAKHTGGPNACNELIMFTDKAVLDGIECGALEVGQEVEFQRTLFRMASNSSVGGSTSSSSGYNNSTMSPFSPGIFSMNTMRRHLSVTAAAAPSTTTTANKSLDIKLNQTYFAQNILRKVSETTGEVLISGTYKIKREQYRNIDLLSPSFVNKKSENWLSRLSRNPLGPPQSIEGGGFLIFK